jgi:UDP-N-acetylmuramate--alanine ligase
MSDHEFDALPELPARVHFIGIGGIGMSGLARILHEWRYQVSGSDANRSDQTDALTAEGIEVTIGHTAVENAAAADVVVITAAVKPENPEFAAAEAAGKPIVKRAKLLGLLANARTCVAVAGSHGKSTTSAMLTSALQALDLDPSYAIGAVLGSTGTNAAPGGGEAMIVEADEFDRSFLQLRPDVALVNNIEYDHPDIFADQDAYDDAFRDFARQVRPGGTLVYAGDDPGCKRAFANLDLGPDAHVVTFGEAEEVDWRLECDENGCRVIDLWGNENPLDLRVPGRHNARNATGAVAALAWLGVRPDEAIAALNQFTGIGRRFEIKGEAEGVLVIDDYAHHPSEIRATLAAAVERFPQRRIVAIFQPHTFSRTKALLADFAEALKPADQAVIVDIYPSRETDDLGVSSRDLAELVPGSVASGNLQETLDYLAGALHPGDLALTIGAGDVSSLGPRILAARERVG